LKPSFWEVEGQGNKNEIDIQKKMVQMGLILWIFAGKSSLEMSLMGFQMVPAINTFALSRDAELLGSPEVLAVSRLCDRQLT
jgi:hypothetical protein